MKTPAEAYIAQTFNAPTMTAVALKEEIRRAVGTRLFTIEYLKKDNTLRHFRAQLGVSKYVKGSSPRESPAHILTIYDHDKKNYRSLDVERILSVRCGDWRMEVSS